MTTLNIEAIIRERNIDLKELAKSIGMTQLALNNIVGGKTDPSVSFLERIAEGLNMPVATMFSDCPAQSEPVVIEREVEVVKGRSGVIVCPSCGQRINAETGTRI